MEDVRKVTLVLVDSAGVVLGELPPFEVAVPYWPEVDVVVNGARQLHGAEVTVLRLLHADRPRPHGGAVTYLAQLDGEPPAGLQSTSFRPVPHPRRAPFAEVGGPAETIAWGLGAISRLGFGTPEEILQRKTWNLAALWRLDGAAGSPLWLKHLPPFLRAESDLLAWLGAVAPGAAPPLLAADGTGRQLLGHLPGEDGFGAPAAARHAMVDLLHGVQVRALADVEHLAGLGVRDRRGAWLREEIVVAAEPWLGEIFGLDAVVHGLPERLAAVAACRLPDTLVHGDFHPGNVRFSATVPPAVLDWGDAFLGNPAFDILAVCEGLAPDEADALVEHWAGRWREAAPGSDPVEAVRLLRPVAPLLSAVVYAGFVHNIEPSEWPYHAEDVPTCLRTAVTLA
ncbi:aminoglycoside phosphotransferase family protein [Dactylosporangium sp. CA-233914]|uniref:aminoglycoside phosphotransferase family protein n=1 Tax=Dactylosporangium sp. CA-233914 TaxID=3239934 RepID=UPI003D903806